MDIDITYKHSLKRCYNYLACKPCKREINNYNYTLFIFTMTTNDHDITLAENELEKKNKIASNFRRGVNQTSHINEILFSINQCLCKDSPASAEKFVNC